MKLESPTIPNKTEKQNEILEQVKKDLIKRVAHLPEDQQEIVIYRILNTEYGLNIEIPKATTNKKTGEENPKETEQDKTLKKIALDLEKRLIAVPESEKGAELERILREEYGVSIQKITEIKKNKNWTSKLLHYGTVAGLLGFAFFSTNITSDEAETIQEDKKELKFTEETQENKAGDIYKMDSIKMPSFDMEVYNSLPNEGKDIYKYYADKNPTPGKGHVFLDKKSANLYVFDQENNLVNTIVAGFGTEKGDEHNTSAEYQKGTRTTPAGVYIISNLSDPRDLVEYGENHLSLFGISTLGNKEFLGIHQTYENNNEKARREKRLATIEASDNIFSDGCINISKEDFEKYIKENFQGEGDELLFILPDDKASAEFETDKLINQIKPVLEEMKNKLKEYNEKQNPSYTKI